MTTITPYYRAAVDYQNIEITYDQYQPYYSEEEWVSRKLEAIPYFLISIVLQTTYHLAMAIIMGAPRLLEQDSRRLEAEICNVARSVEAAFGHLLTIINDERGSYYVDRSNFFIEKNIKWAVENEAFEAAPSPQKVKPNPSPSPPNSPLKPPLSTNSLQSENDPSPSSQIPKNKTRHPLSPLHFTRRFSQDDNLNYQSYDGKISTRGKRLNRQRRQRRQRYLSELARQSGERIEFSTPLLKPFDPEVTAAKMKQQRRTTDLFGELLQGKSLNHVETKKGHLRRSSSEVRILGLRTFTALSPQKEPFSDFDDDLSDFALSPTSSPLTQPHKVHSISLPKAPPLLLQQQPPPVPSHIPVAPSLPPQNTHDSKSPKPPVDLTAQIAAQFAKLKKPQAHPGPPPLQQFSPDQVLNVKLKKTQTPSDRENPSPSPHNNPGKQSPQTPNLMGELSLKLEMRKAQSARKFRRKPQEKNPGHSSVKKLNFGIRLRKTRLKKEQKPSHQTTPIGYRKKPLRRGRNRKKPFTSPKPQSELQARFAKIRKKRNLFTSPCA